MNLQIQVENVVAAKEYAYFIAVQLEYEDKVTPSVKLRTEVVGATNRPKFGRNLFSFDRIIELQKVRFGLMVCGDASEASASNAKMIGTASIALSRDRLKGLPMQGSRQMLRFKNKDKEVGQFQCIIKYRQSSKTQEKVEEKVKASQLQFNPLISRILFTEQAAKDELKTQNCLAQLQKQMSLLYRSYSSLKTEEQQLQNLLSTLTKDGEEIKSDIDTFEKINEKIAVKINQKQHLDALKLEIDMLKNTEEGKRLLLQRLEYFEERILVERDEYRKLQEKYERIKGEIERRIKDAEDYASRLRAKQLQLFELKRSEGILSRYEEILYEFKCNQQIIESLAQKSTKSELTAQQAALLLSQVNFKIQLEEVGTPAQDEGLLKMIEGQAAFLGKYQQEEISQEERLVLEIKLSALQQEISNIRNKIKKVAPRQKVYESQVTKL